MTPRKPLADRLIPGPKKKLRPYALRDLGPNAKLAIEFVTANPYCNSRAVERWLALQNTPPEVHSRAETLLRCASSYRRTLALCVRRGALCAESAGKETLYWTPCPIQDPELWPEGGYCGADPLRHHDSVCRDGWGRCSCGARPWRPTPTEPRAKKS